MTVTKADAEKNIRKFLEKHGREGFLRLLLTNYLFELVMYYLHTERNKPVVQEETGYEFYVDGRGRAYAPEQIEQFKKDLRAECARKAESVVAAIKGKELLEKLDQDILSDPEVSKLIQEAFATITRKS